MSEHQGNGKVTVIVYPGFTYKESISYGSDMAKIHGSVLNIKAVVPEFGISERAALSMYEFGLHDKILAQTVREAEAFFDCVKGFCKANGVEAVFDKAVGSVEDVIDDMMAEAPDTNTTIVVPMPTDKLTHIANKRDYKIEKTTKADLSNCNVVLVI